MIKKLFTSIVLFFVLTSTVVYALDSSYSAFVENKGSKNYKAIKLTPKIYNNLKGDIAGLALYDKNKEPIPYFINTYIESKIETQKSYEMKIINSFVKDEYFYYDYTLKDVQNEDVTATSIEIKTDKDGFAKKVELLGGYDNVNWEKIQEDILYNVGGNNKLEILFNNVKKYTHYRFKIPNNLEKVSFSSVALKYNKVLQKKEYFTDTVSPNYTTEERGNTTVLKIQEFKNLRLSSITLKTDSVFKRNVSFDGRASKMLYNLEFQSTKYRDLTIGLNMSRITADSVEIVIDNKDDKPIKILEIEAKYLVDEMIFEGAKSSEFILKFGSTENLTPKSYDISNYRDQILNEGYDVLSIKEVKEEPSKVSVQETVYDYKLIFNIVISLVAVVMGILLILKLKK